MKTKHSGRCAPRQFALLLIAGLALPAGAWATGPDLLANRFSLGLGVYDESSDTKVRLNGQSSIGDRIDLENTFGVGTITRFRVDGFWRIAKRHKLGFMWFTSDANRKREIEEEIEWGGEVYPVGAAVALSRSFDIYQLSYGYTFVRRDNFELAVSAGLHYSKARATLSATLDVADDPTLTREATDTARLDAPLPVLGLAGMWNIGGDFWLDGAARWFAMSFDEYDGALVDVRGVVLWQPRSWFGLGLGYDYFGLDMDVDKRSFRGSLDWSYDGPQLFLNLAF
ncbi:MAG: hypothetical protein P8080_09955 [Gammaproteobacteria bacterium]